MIGIYTIKNLKNNKLYIGSSVEIEKRIRTHFVNLIKNNHSNLKLQNSYNKYGKENFIFEILETFDEIERDDLFTIEQKYIDSYDFDTLYNLTNIANCGGPELLKKESFIIDLRGNILEEFNCLIDIAKYFNRKQISTTSINTPSIIKSKYRIVTKEFYENNIDLILSWKNYSKIKDSYNQYYKYNNINNKWEVIYNNEIIYTSDVENNTIRVSKHLDDMIKKQII